MQNELKSYFININNSCNNINKELTNIKENTQNIDKLGKNIDIDTYNTIMAEIRQLTKKLQEINKNEYKK